MYTNILFFYLFRIRIGADKPPKVLEPESDSSDEEEEQTEEEKQLRKEFELKR